MDNDSQQILAKAMEKRNAALAEAEYWADWIKGYELLGRTDQSQKSKTETVVLPYATSKNDKAPSWPQIHDVAKEIIAMQGAFENAAFLTEELMRRGFETSKEKVSACLTHYRGRGELTFDKEKGGWTESSGEAAIAS